MRVLVVALILFTMGWVGGNIAHSWGWAWAVIWIIGCFCFLVCWSLCMVSGTIAREEEADDEHHGI